MNTWTLRRPLSALAVAVALTFGSASAGMAQQITPQQFQANPGLVLANFPSGGLLAASVISQILIADPTALPLVMGLLANANDNQAAAIGRALGLAAIAVRPTNPGYYDQIQAQALATNNPAPEITAYNEVTGNTSIGSVGGGGGAGGPGGGGGPTDKIIGTGGGGGGGGTPPQSFGTNNLVTNHFTFSGIGASGPGSLNSAARATSP
jgi:hypothetical protein